MLISKEERLCWLRRFPTEPNRRKIWEEALADQTQTNGNMICIEHFSSNDYAVKGSKFYLNKSAVPSIFANQTEFSKVDDVPAVECSSNDANLNGMCEECQKLKREISILIDRCNAIEEEKLSVEDTLKLTIESQEEVIRRIRAQLEALKKKMNKSDLVRYALNDNVDPKVIILNQCILNCNDILFCSFIASEAKGNFNLPCGRHSA